MGPSSRCAYDLESLVEKLMGKLLMEVLKEAEEQALRNSERGQLRQSSNLRPSPLCFSDQWRCSLALATQPKVRVRPHDASVVHRLVGASVEALWGPAGGSMADSTEAPAYLAGKESQRAYRQVIFDLTSEVFHEVLKDRKGTSQSPWELKETSSVLPVSSSKTFLGNVKAAIQAEVQRELNLERTDVQTREKMRNLCKYGTMHRDRVDYILIQELHKEELQWVDYNLDQCSVKMQLTEEIFDIILKDTATRLYSSEDPLTILTSDTLKEALHNSSAAWLIQFYSSWCGHCIQYSPTWKALAGDVKDWEQAIRIGVLDCAHEKNFEVCKDFGIHFYPTFRYFKARSSTFDVGKTYRGPDRELQTVRQLMVNFLQNHTRDDWPVGCPPLEPSRSEDILSLLGKKSEQYTAVIIENEDSYVGREVILDLMMYEGLRVTRAVSSDRALLEKLGVAAVPSAYLLHPNGTHALMDVQKRLRFFFSSFLKLLPGVRRKQADSAHDPLHAGNRGHGAAEVWKEFDKSKVYMVDLESGLHYLLRVELASHQTLEGEELKTFKDFVTVIAKLFPGRPSVVKLLETLLEWLVSLPLERIPYDAILDLVNNKMRISGMFLSDRLQWVGCQGSRPELRGYPCSLWTLFHTLTVQAAHRPDALANTGLEEDPLAVLQTMRRYIGTFFGCQECGRHFEEMAKESLSQVRSLDQAVLWLWSKHNQVNSRLTGALSEDSRFPKAQWPTPDLCPACHEERDGLHVWNEDRVLSFLKRHYAGPNISPKYASGTSPETGGAAEPAPPGNQGPPPPSNRDHHPRQGDAHLPNAPPTQEKQQQQQRSPGQAGEADAPVPKETRPGVSFLGLGFSSVDMSLCVLLYGFSCLFLMLMFFFFRMRSKRWKVRHSRPYV
ncbi:hypothetical protein AAFF_G00010130 [Aldrovandia affinis]|uniref:Sulfhydryl oxidase n=1 Tax=Aldrovandia affinis TaxID=143900 RepID=A0AAD7S725_9TELE|nr:hypothetical protein AAFF_G00010130 [Aldrovandia affinis]